jgi:hypothetical protein
MFTENMNHDSNGRTEAFYSSISTCDNAVIANCAQAEREKEDRRHALKRRIDEVDATIDRLVYELYGLTEEEIRIVEEER